MRFMRGLILVLVFQRALLVNGHGWLMVPTPRSGGGTGSGNASTQGPCGKAGPTTVTASYPAGQPFQVQYKRANNHGNTGDTVVFRLSYTAATGTPTQAQFDAGTIYPTTGKFEMRVDTSQPQTQTLTAPSTPGMAVLQFEWKPTSGGTWYDCAYIEILDSGPCATNNGGCDANAACTGNGVCTCKDGYFGNGKECTELPPATPFAMTVNSPTVVQDTFTSNVATLLGVEEGRVLYDKSTPQGSMSVVDFSVGADPVTGADATSLGHALANRILNGDPSVASTLSYEPVALSVNGGPSVGFGEGFEDTTRNPMIATAAVSLVVAAAVVVGMSYRKRAAGGHGHGLNVGGKRKAVPTSSPVAQPTPQLQHQSSSPVVQPELEDGWSAQQQGYDAQDQGAEAYAETGTQQGDWERHTDEASGMPYFYNPTTGETTWDEPTV